MITLLKVYALGYLPYLFQAKLDVFFFLANCPAGLYYNLENDTCVDYPHGTYQTNQGQNECIHCGQNLTTAMEGTVEEKGCVGKVSDSLIICARSHYFDISLPKVLFHQRLVIIHLSLC